MSAELQLCANCDKCTVHSLETVEGTPNSAITVHIDHGLSRSCGAGNTSSENPSCVNGRFVKRKIPIVYTPNLIRKMLFNIKYNRAAKHNGAH